MDDNQASSRKELGGFGPCGSSFSSFSFLGQGVLNEIAIGVTEISKVFWLMNFYSAACLCPDTLTRELYGAFMCTLCQWAHFTYIYFNVFNVSDIFFSYIRFEKGRSNEKRNEKKFRLSKMFRVFQEPVW